MEQRSTLAKIAIALIIGIALALGGFISASSAPSGVSPDSCPAPASYGASSPGCGG